MFSVARNSSTMWNPIGIWMMMIPTMMALTFRSFLNRMALILMPLWMSILALANLKSSGLVPNWWSWTVTAILWNIPPSLRKMMTMRIFTSAAVVALMACTARCTTNLMWLLAMRPYGQWTLKRVLLIAISIFRPIRLKSWMLKLESAIWKSASATTAAIPSWSLNRVFRTSRLRFRLRWTAKSLSIQPSLPRISKALRRSKRAFGKPLAMAQMWIVSSSSWIAVFRTSRWSVIDSLSLFRGHSFHVAQLCLSLRHNCSNWTSKCRRKTNWNDLQRTRLFPTCLNILTNASCRKASPCKGNGTPTFSITTTPSC